MNFYNNPGKYIFHSKQEWGVPLENDFMDILKEIPWYSYLTTPFERDVDLKKIFLWTTRHYYISYITCILYMIFIYVGPKIMEKHRPFKLNTSLRYWNLFLAIFSFIGSIRVLPYTIVILYKYGFASSICSPAFVALSKGPSSLWMFLFVYSKYIELLDTVFIVLRKRQLTFLHWFHHLTVLMYTWDAYITCQSIGVHFSTVNYCVHSVMYYYYYLASSGYKPSWGIIITIFQIVQMIIGTFITVLSIYLSYKYPMPSSFPTEYLSNPLKIGCFFIRNNGLFACLMYLSYFGLFFDFFIKKYITKGTPLASSIVGNKKRD